MRTLLLTIAAALSLSACASNTNERSLSQAEMDRLQRECTARGGILVPTGRITGREPLDNICRIQGPATRIRDKPPV